MNISDLEYKFQVKKGIIYLCISGNPQARVKDTEIILKEFIGNSGNLKDLIQQKRYKKEVWSPN